MNGTGKLIMTVDMTHLTAVQEVESAWGPPTRLDRTFNSMLQLGMARLLFLETRLTI